MMTLEAISEISLRKMRMIGFAGVIKMA